MNDFDSIFGPMVRAKYYPEVCNFFMKFKGEIILEVF